MSDLKELREAARLVGRTDYSFNLDVLSILSKGHAYSVWYKDEFLGLGGVEPAPDFGVIWLIGTNAADKRIVPLTRWLKNHYVVKMTQVHGRLMNLVPAKMERRLDWLEKIGFDTDREEAQKLGREIVTFWTQSSKRPDETALRS